MSPHAMTVEAEKAPRSQSQPTFELVSGDVAVAYAALDAGIGYASAYPGTPATDIQEAVLRFADSKSVKALWSINEKVAYESALAAAIAGQRALVSMKQVGLNVAADAFLNSCPAGVNAGLVLAVGDDPECHSSQNRQDTRHYRDLAGNLLLEPSDSQEAYDMTREAFALSERFRLPVIIRLTTRTCYGCTPLWRHAPDTRDTSLRWPKEPDRFFIVPNVSRRLYLRLAQIQSEMADVISHSQFSRMPTATSHTGFARGVLCTGIGYALAKELAAEHADILKVGGEPFPEGPIKAFVEAHKEILVLEEGDPILESRARMLAKQGTIVKGRLSGSLKPVGELQTDEIRAALAGKTRPNPPTAGDVAPRIPEICKPCGYHKVFGALKGLQDIATPSDIGCNSLGGIPPYSVMDGVWSMGSSIGVACGLAALGHPKVLAILGDSTFFHAGIPPLIEAVHEGYRMTVLLLDNGTAAMTGGQGVAHRSDSPIQASVDLVRLVKAIGVASCRPFDPHELGEDGIRVMVEESFCLPGVKVLLYRSQCGIYNPGYFTSAKYSLKKKG